MSNDRNRTIGETKVNDSSLTKKSERAAGAKSNESISPNGVIAPKEAICNFNIPPPVLQAALKALKGPKKTLWSHELYRNSAGDKVALEVCRTLAESETAVKKFINEPILGFDMEWNMWAKETSPLKENISVIQIACEDRIAVLHLAAFTGNTINELVSPTLKKIIESDKIVKTGSHIYQADCSRLKKFFKLKPRAIIELSDMQSLAKFGQLRSSKFSLAGGTLEHLLLPLSKDDRKSKWHHKTLEESQIRYAAADAYASYMLFRTLEWRRENLRKVPLRPPFAELEIPSKNFDTSLGLLRDLKIWRDRFAAAEGLKVDSVIPFTVMQKAAHYQPTTIKQIERIPGIQAHLPLDYPHEMIAVVKAFKHKQKGGDSTEITQSQTNDDTLVREFDASKFKFSPEQPKASTSRPEMSQLEMMVSQVTSQEPTQAKCGTPVMDGEQFDRTCRNLSTLQVKLSNKTGLQLNDILSAITLQDLASQRPSTVTTLLAVDGVESLVKAATAAGWDNVKLLEEVTSMYAGTSKSTRRRLEHIASTPESSPLVPSLHTGLSFDMAQTALEHSPCPKPSSRRATSSSSRKTTRRQARPSVVSIASDDSFEFGTMPTPRKRKVSTTEKDEISPDRKRTPSQHSHSSSDYGSALEGSEDNPLMVLDGTEDAQSDYSFGSSIGSDAWEAALVNSQTPADRKEKVMVKHADA